MSMRDYEGMNLHTTKWASILGVKVLMDLQIFREWLRGQNPLDWRVLKTQVMAKRRVESQIANLTPNH